MRARKEQPLVLGNIKREGADVIVLSARAQMPLGMVISLRARVDAGPGYSRQVLLVEAADRQIVRNSLRHRDRLGMVMPIHAGAPGKIFLAFDPGARKAIEESELNKFTPNTPDSLEVLDQQAEVARSRGFYAAFGERMTAKRIARLTVAVAKASSPA